MTFYQFQKTYSGNGKVREPNPGETITRCCTMQTASQIGAQLPPSFTEIAEARDAQFRVAWESPRELAIVTFCEGDVDIQTFETIEGFRSGLENIIRFYRGIQGVNQAS